MKNNIKKKNLKSKSVDVNDRNNFLGDDFPTGPIRYTLRNDYMFKAVLQKNEKALKGLLAALLSIPVKDILGIEIMNPIELGEAVDDKTCILDIKVKLNNSKIINIELQVAYFKDWVERSLTYLCKMFDNIHAGQKYGEVLPTYHIGILDFWLPEKTKEFYSEYRLLNVNNHELYSSKFGINVLNLKAVEDDSVTKDLGDLYEWAKLFKATTWEEIKMLADKNEYIADTVVTLRQLSDDEKVKLQAEARWKYEHDIASYIGQGREEGEAIGEARGIEKERQANIKKLANFYMNQNPNMTEEEAFEMAKTILE